jgi:methylated-DNA-[protein]-cysteine S-methyltransferase
MPAAEFQIFETSLGRCAILWRGALIIRILLPTETEGSLRAAVMRAQADIEEAPPPAPIASVAAKIAAFCRGEAQDFAPAPLDRSQIDPFAARVYAALDKVGFGETTSYSAVAEALGDRSLARAVGAALGANPFPIVIPCHRVTGANGAIGGFSAPGGTGTKRRLLDIEGAFAASRLPLFAH